MAPDSTHNAMWYAQSTIQTLLRYKHAWSCTKNNHKIEYWLCCMRTAYQTSNNRPGVRYSFLVFNFYNYRINRSIITYGVPLCLGRELHGSDHCLNYTWTPFGPWSGRYMDSTVPPLVLWGMVAYMDPIPFKSILSLGRVLHGPHCPPTVLWGMVHGPHVGPGQCKHIVQK